MSDSTFLIKPYEGDKNYVFVSYSHADSEIVLPVLKKLYDNGYRIWFDEGIDPGTEWPESIAIHLSQCKVLLAFLSNNSINSSNCKREINYGISLNKEFLSVVLEPIKMTPGMEMQISSYQSLLSYKYPDQEAFEDKLMSLDILKSCQEVTVHEVKTEIPHVITKEKEQPEAQTRKSEKTVSDTSDKETDKKEKKAAREKARKKIEMKAKKTSSRKKGPGKLLWVGLLVLALIGFLVAKQWFDEADPFRKKLIIGDTTYSDGTRVHIEDQTLTIDNLKVLSEFKQCSNLEFVNCTFSDGDLSRLKALNTLNTLSFTNCKNMGNLSFVNSLDKLYSFSAESCGLTDSSFEGVVFPERLYELDLNNNTLTAVPQAKNLQELSMGYNKLTDLSSLENCSTLYYARLNNNQIEDISALSNCTAIQELNLNNNKIVDISALEPCVYLKNLYLGNNKIVNSAPLKYTTLLENVNISGNREINNLNFLEKNAGTLKWLNASNIDESKLAVLYNLVNIEQLIVCNCNLKSIAFVSNMPNLKNLNAATNNISDISPLSECTSLSLINLAKNSIVSIKDLPVLTGFDKALILHNNKITNLEGIQTNASYQLVTLFNNPLSEGDAINDIQIYRLIIDMTEAINPEHLGKCSRVYVPDKNLSVQVKWESVLSYRLYYETLDEAWKESLDYCSLTNRIYVP